MISLKRPRGVPPALKDPSSRSCRPAAILSYWASPRGDSHPGVYGAAFARDLPHCTGCWFYRHQKNVRGQRSSPVSRDRCAEPVAGTRSAQDASWAISLRRAGSPKSEMFESEAGAIKNRRFGCAGPAGTRRATRAGARPGRHPRCWFSELGNGKPRRHLEVQSMQIVE